ncbi:MAG TPA: serine hydroxymethyltransferase, partial [Polyangia bacterium]|nr:serine hydroxymethyltransferase [Polyangia bacterium]
MVGASAYPRIIDFAFIRRVASEIGTPVVVDMAHIAGLVAAGLHPSPVPHADFVTTTTHKTLRGPRGAIIMCKERFAKDVDRTVFPGIQGGPHDHINAAKAVCFHEALQPDFRTYARQTIENARAMAGELMRRGHKILTDGTDNHLMVVDLRRKNLTGKIAEAALDKAGISCSRSTIPFDTRKALDPSGIRLGTPALTTRGMGTAEAVRVAGFIDDAIAQHADEQRLAGIRDEVRALCRSFPLYGMVPPA